MWCACWLGFRPQTVQIGSSRRTASLSFRHALLL
jgi:hypothetical protein